MTKINTLAELNRLIKTKRDDAISATGIATVDARQQGTTYWKGSLLWSFLFSNVVSATIWTTDGNMVELLIWLKEQSFQTGQTLAFTPADSHARFVIENGEHAQDVPGTGTITVREYIDDVVLKAEFAFSFERNGKLNEIVGDVNIDLTRQARHT